MKTHTAASTDSFYDGIATISDVVANVTDDDTAGVTITETGTPTPSTDVTEDGATTDDYTVVLDTQPTADVTITITPDAQTTVSPTSLIFTSSNWNAAQTVTVTGENDLIDEADLHPSTITHSAGSTDSFYSGIFIDNVVTNVTDDDRPAQSFTTEDGSVHNAEYDANGGALKWDVTTFFGKREDGKLGYTIYNFELARNKYDDSQNRIMFQGDVHRTRRFMENGEWVIESEAQGVIKVVTGR